MAFQHAIHSYNPYALYSFQENFPVALSRDLIWWLHDTLKLRDECRLENRKAFANIWSDMVLGISLFILLYFCQSQVSLLKFTVYKRVNNITDTGKAFLIILITDIFLGYHSESSWETLLQIIVAHYGFEVDQASITIFVCLIPVIIYACLNFCQDYPPGCRIFPGK